VTTERYTRYTPQDAAIDPSAAEEILREGLTERLKSQIDGEIVSAEVATVTENGRITVTMTAECLEQIALVREIE
jgi:hypothetical protein